MKSVTASGAALRHSVGDPTDRHRLLPTMDRFAPSELNSLARGVADRVREGRVEWQGDAIVFDGECLRREAEAAATAIWSARTIAGQALAFLEYWVASEPYAFDEAGRAWRRRHDALVGRIRLMRAWQGGYRAVQTRLVQLNFELDRLLTQEGDRRADAENAAIERGDVIPTRAVLAAA